MEENIDIQTKFWELASENVDIYCHFTDASGEDIITQGLYVASDKWYKSFLKLEKSELEDIFTFIANYGKSYGRSNTMIVLAVFKDLDTPFIRKNNTTDAVYSNWVYDGLPEYIVDSEFIFGYVDLNEMKLIINSDSLVAEELMIL